MIAPRCADCARYQQPVHCTNCRNHARFVSRARRSKALACRPEQPEVRVHVCDADGVCRDCRHRDGCHCTGGECICGPSGTPSAFEPKQPEPYIYDTEDVTCVKCGKTYLSGQVTDVPGVGLLCEGCGFGTEADDEPEAHPSHDFSDPYCREVVEWLPDGKKAYHRLCSQCGKREHGAHSLIECHPRPQWRNELDHHVAKHRRRENRKRRRKLNKERRKRPEPPPRTAFDSNPAVGGPLSLSAKWRR